MHNAERKKSLEMLLYEDQSLKVHDGTLMSTKCPPVCASIHIRHKSNLNILKGRRKQLGILHGMYQTVEGLEEAPKCSMRINH
jgi:hypothetical protein